MDANAKIDSFLGSRNQVLPRVDLQTFLALASVILLALALRLAYGCFLCNPDSFAYIRGAQRIIEVGPSRFLATLGDIYENRVSIVFPLAAFIKLFGFSQLTFALMPLTFSLGTVVLAFLFGTSLVDDRVGLLTALLVAVMPLDTFYGSAVFPDTLIPVYTVLALFTYLVGTRNQHLVWFVLSGFFAFCAFQARATSAIVLLVCFLFALSSGKRSVNALVVAPLTFLTCNLLLWTTLRLMGGSFFSQFALWVTDATNESYLGTSPLLGHLHNVLRIDTRFGIFYWLAFPSWFLLAYLSRRNVEYRLPLIAFALIYLFFEFGSTTITSYEPIWKIDRFLTILTVPASLVAAITSRWLFGNLNRLGRLALFALLSAVILFPTGQMLYTALVDTDREEHVYQTTFERLAHEPDVDLVGVINFRWSLRGDVYSRLYGRDYSFVDLRERRPNDVEPGATVIFDPLFFSPHGERFSSPDDYPLIKYLPENPPSDWQTLFTIERAGYEEYPVVVYRVGE